MVDSSFIAREFSRRMAFNILILIVLANFIKIPVAEGSPLHHQEHSSCNYITLVKCFINVLDDWAWTLYELKDNVVTINRTQCEHLKQLEKCINDDGLDEPHECQHKEIIAASNTVSDLLMHRKNSGSFLKSYYLLTYACSAEGQELLNEHRPCLSRESIGEMTLSAGTYLSEKFLEREDDDVCPDVNSKLQEYMDAMAGLCEEEASIIMCKSLTNMFKGIHPDKLSHCEFTCLKRSVQRLPPGDPPEDDYSEEEEVEEASQQPPSSPPSQQAEHESLSGGNGAPRFSIGSTSALTLLMLLIATSLCALGLPRKIS